MSKRPFELFLSSEVQELLDNFASLLEVRVTFFSRDGEYLRRGKEMRNSDYCHMVQTDFDGWHACVSMDNDKLNEALRCRGAISYRCHGGLRECLAPVIIRDMPVGFVMFGQFRLSGDELPEFAGATPEQRLRMQRAFNSLPCFTQEKLNAVLGMLHTLIDYISIRELAVIQGDRLRNEIDKYIERHAAEDIRLPDMARKLGRSVSTISQFLRKNYNVSFKSLLLEARLQLAESCWHSNPVATVAEVAAASGFRDQFYFSRVFRKMRGIPPAKFRNMIRLSASPFAVCKKKSGAE